MKLVLTSQSSTLNVYHVLGTLLIYLSRYLDQEIAKYYNVQIINVL